MSVTTRDYSMVIGGAWVDSESGARSLMDDHVRMIRARRVAEHATVPTQNCC